MTGIHTPERGDERPRAAGAGAYTPVKLAGSLLNRGGARPGGRPATPATAAGYRPGDRIVDHRFSCNDPAQHGRAARWGTVLAVGIDRSPKRGIPPALYLDVRFDDGGTADLVADDWECWRPYACPNAVHPDHPLNLTDPITGAIHTPPGTPAPARPLPVGA